MNNQDTSKNTCALTLIPGADLKREWLEMKPSTLLRKRAVKSPFELHEWQQQTYKQLRNKLLVLLNVPTGAGKSTAIMVAQVSNLIDNPTRKTIVAVPKTAIADNYVRNSSFRLPGGGLIDLCGMVGTNMCDDDGMDGSKTTALLEFLRAKPAVSTLNPKDVRDRLFLCSHALLSLVYDQIRDTPEAASLFKNVTIVVDEAHHVMNNESEEEGGARDFVRNRLGELVHFLTNSVSRAGVWLVTATAFRGDGLSMVPVNDKVKFTQFSMTFEEHWRKNLPEIQSYCYDFATYKPGMSDSVFRGIVKMFGRSKMIVFCGNSLHATTGGCKYESVKRLSEIIREEWGGDTEILDLVTDDHERETRKRQLKDHSGSIDVVFALRIMDEGMDWPEAQNAIDMSPLRSLPIVYQRFGRLTRNFKGKSALRYVSMLPVPEGGEDRDTQIQMFNENLACLMGAMMLEDLAQSMRFGQKNAGKKSGRKPTNWLAKAFPDADKLKDIRTKGWVELNTLYAEAKESGEAVSGERVTEVLREVLEDAGITENLDKVTESLLNHSRYLMWRGSRASRGLGGASAKEIVEAGLKPFKFMEEMEGGWWYTSQACGVETCGEWKKLREDADERAWMEKFEENKRIWEKTGSHRVPEGRGLGYWQKGQRENRNKSILSQDKIKLLDSIGFDWDPMKTLSENAYGPFVSHLKQFVETYGNADVLLPFVCSDGYRLGYRAKCIRKHYRKKHIPETYQKQIEDLGFRWSILTRCWSPRSFSRARSYIRSLKFKSVKEYSEWISSGKRPKDIPSNPKISYPDDFVDMRDWLNLQDPKPKKIKVKAWTVVSPSGERYVTENLKLFSEQNGLYYPAMKKVSRKAIAHHCGWKISRKGIITRRELVSPVEFPVTSPSWPSILKLAQSI